MNGDPLVPHRMPHADTRKHATEAELDEACRPFTAWKADKDKARRQER